MGDLVEVNPSESSIICAFGRKGSGKTTWLRSFWDSWPFDKIAIDVNGDLEPGPDAIEIYEPLGDYFPTFSDDWPKNLHFKADPGSPTYRESLDQALMLATFPQDKKVLAFMDEIGEFTTGNQTDPNLRRILMQSRHYNVSALIAGPRPMDIDTLIIGQADLIAIYDLPNLDDQARIAKTIGYPVGRFSEAITEMRALGPYYHLLWVTPGLSKSGSPTLAICNPIELD